MAARALPENRRTRRERQRTLVAEASRIGLTADRRDAERARGLAETPGWYSPWAHLAATAGVGVVTCVAAAIAMHALPAPRARDLAVLPIVFLLANLAEWRMHKALLHRRRWFLPIAYDLHTAMHHMIYVEWDMAFRSARELRLVLMPASGVLALVVGTTPLAYLVGWLFSPQAGWLFLVGASLSLVGYELLHLSYHVDPDTFVGRLRVVRILRAHHARHHNPRLMQRYNFNVTVPLFDWVMGTMAPPREKPRGARAAAR